MEIIFAGCLIAMALERIARAIESKDNDNK